MSLLKEELKRQIARLQAALAAWPADEDSEAARQKVVQELEHRLGLLALLEPVSRA